MTLIVRDANTFDVVERELARGTGDDPELPKLAKEALELAQKAELQADEFVELADRDPVVTARLLAVANSALYARSVPTATIKNAFLRIGLQASRDVLYQVAYGAMLDAPRELRHEIALTYEHGVRTARIVRRLASRFSLDPQTAFLAALLHDFGRARCLRIATRRCKNAPQSEIAAAVEQFHATAGSQLASAWNLPVEVREVCSVHHEPGTNKLAALVALCDLLEHATADDAQEPNVNIVDKSFEYLSVSAEECEEFINLARAEKQEHME